jgi:hypothetical protein
MRSFKVLGIRRHTLALFALTGLRNRGNLAFARLYLLFGVI